MNFEKFETVRTEIGESPGLIRQKVMKELARGRIPDL
jgi:hypothetical protein